MSQTVLQATERGNGEHGTRATEDTENELSRDEIFHILRSQRRRYALHYLKHHDGPTTIGELADQLTAWENDVPMELITSRQRKRIYNSLQQTHLPNLDQAGLVEYDSERGYVVLTDSTARLDIYLEVVDERELPWAQFYLGLGSLSIVLVLAVWIEAFPFVLFPDIVWGAVVATALFLSGIAHTMSLQAARLGDGDVPPEIRTE